MELHTELLKWPVQIFREQKEHIKINVFWPQEQQGTNTFQTNPFIFYHPRTTPYSKMCNGYIRDRLCYIKLKDIKIYEF